MSRVPLSQSTFKPVSEGVHTFTVTSVEYDEAFSKINIKMTTESGEKHSERFILSNDKALFAFTMTAKALMGRNDIVDVDTNDLVGKSMVATVEHTESNGKTYARLIDKAAVGEVETTDTESDELDLDNLFDEE